MLPTIREMLNTAITARDSEVRVSAARRRRRVRAARTVLRVLPLSLPLSVPVSFVAPTSALAPAAVRSPMASAVGALRAVRAAVTA